MTKPVLPPCSVRDCNRAAGAIINGDLLCADHAVEEMTRRAMLRKDGTDKMSSEP